MSRRAARVVLGLVVVATFGCRSKSHEKTNEVTPEPLADQTTEQTEPEAHPGYIGVLTPKAQAEVVAPFATTVKQFDANVGDAVTVGMKLAVLDDAPIRAELDKSAADLAGARAGYGAAVSKAATQRKAFTAGVAAKAEVIAAEGAAAEARARVDSAKSSYDSVKAKLTKTTLLAPIDGKVALQYIKQGGQVAEGAPVLRLISSDELYVKFAIPTDESNRLAVGAAIDIQIEAHGEHITTRGVVTRIQPELDPIAQMIFAEAELSGEPTGKLQSGLVCRIRPAAAAAPGPATPAPPPPPPPATGSAAPAKSDAVVPPPPATPPPAAPSPRPSGKKRR